MTPWPLLSALVLALAQAPAVTFESLSPSQQSDVRRGKPVQILQPVDSSAWPRSIVFQFIAATPEECAAVLSDYDRQATYVPRMKSSKVIAHHGANVTDVEYVIDIPVFPDERSVSRQWVSTANGRYQVHWRTVVDSGQTGSRTTGVATFVPFIDAAGRSGTLLVHDQTVIPSSVFASVPFVRRKGIEVSVGSVTATANQVVVETQKQQPLLASQVRRLREALAAPGDSSARER